MSLAPQETKRIIDSYQSSIDIWYLFQTKRVLFEFNLFLFKNFEKHFLFSASKKLLAKNSPDSNDYLLDLKVVALSCQRDFKVNGTNDFITCTDQTNW